MFSLKKEKGKNLVHSFLPMGERRDNGNAMRLPSFFQKGKKNCDSQGKKGGTSRSECLGGAKRRLGAGDCAMTGGKKRISEYHFDFTAWLYQQKSGWPEGGQGKKRRSTSDIA